MRDNPPSIMLFSAGFGTRMLHLTKDCPKPLVKVANKALIDHTLELTAIIEPKTIVANLHYLPQMLQAHLANTSVQTLLEMPDILETGGGLRNALPLLGNEPVITMNTDAIWKGQNPLKMLLDAWDPEKMDALLLCVPLLQTFGYKGKGNFSIDSDGHLSRQGEFVYGGIQITKTNRLHDISETSFSLNLIWDQMLQDNRLFGLIYDGHWCDVGSPEGVGIAEEMLHA